MEEHGLRLPILKNQKCKQAERRTAERDAQLQRPSAQA